MESVIAISFLILCTIGVIWIGVWIVRDALSSEEFYENDTLELYENSKTPIEDQFQLTNALLIIGKTKNDAACSEQRRLLKTILPKVLKEKIRIIEMYGKEAPTQNGNPLDWLDNRLLRGTLNAEKGFNLIYVNDTGRTNFQSTSPVLSAALELLLHLPTDTHSTPQSALFDPSLNHPVHASKKSPLKIAAITPTEPEAIPAHDVATAQNSSYKTAVLHPEQHKTDLELLTAQAKSKLTTLTHATTTSEEVNPFMPHNYRLKQFGPASGLYNRSRKKNRHKTQFIKPDVKFPLR